MVIILDAGHGESTPGKRSPDGKLREYKYCREIMNEVKRQLVAKGFKVETTVTDNTDVPLNTRCRLVNKIVAKYKKGETLLVSIHCNAAGSGSAWMSARGWSVFVGNNASTNSKKLATYLAESTEKLGLKVRKPSPNQDYWNQSLAICRDTNCPAVLTENLFQDNKEDVDYLLSENGRKTIVNLHINGILKYINNI